MAYDIDALITEAEAEVGYMEKATNALLDSKTANAGKGNFTKYGLARGCNGQPWCDAFVDEMFIQAFGNYTAKSLLCGFSNYTPTSAQYFQTKGLWVRNKPQKGDVIFFHNGTRICHTGIVYKVDSTYVYTIEGNTSGGSDLVANGGCVAKKKYSQNYQKIKGYGRPNYTGTDTPTLYLGSKGVAVKKMQKALNKAFPDNPITEDGDFGMNTFNKLVESQGLWNIQKDGVCGKITWNKLGG